MKLKISNQDIISSNTQTLPPMISCLLGYSIFVVRGNLPESEADQLLKLCPAESQKKPFKTSAHKLVNKTDLTAALQQASGVVGGDGMFKL